jgi:hypothetical protein
LEGTATARTLLDLTGTQIVLETPVSNLDLGQTLSAHPAWRDLLWHVIHVGEWLHTLEDVALQSTAQGFLQTLDPLKKLSPHGGAYLREAHYLRPNWQQTYFGSFYDRLAEVKKADDPTHIFDCYKCVGWRGSDESVYSLVLQDFIAQLTCVNPFYSCYS